MPAARSKKSNRFSQLKTAGIAVAVASAGFLGLLFNKSRQSIYVPSYRAVRVTDGDTFVTAEDQYIRLANADAPELNLCGGQEAKKELEKLVLNQDIYLKVVYHDSTREMALVYNRAGSVDEQMLASGWAEVHSQDGADAARLNAATQKARSAKLGVFSKLCTQAVNYAHPDCPIKGNVKLNSAVSLNAVGMTYYFPGCDFYDSVYVQLHKGDQWFCTEAEARKAGFTKAKTCPASYK